jgi:hypothetical protein
LPEYPDNAVIDDIRYRRGLSTDDIRHPPGVSAGCAHKLNNDCIHVRVIAGDAVVSWHLAGMLVLVNGGVDRLLIRIQ